MPAEKLTPIERRVLAYLDQRGGHAHRQTMAQDLSSPESKTARRGGGGSNGAAPLIVGKWCKRLIRRGLVTVRSSGGFYQHHAITDEGRKAVRADFEQQGRA